MAVTIDVGEANDLHPQNKKDIALRLSLAARRMIFGEPIVAQGPLFGAPGTGWSCAEGAFLPVSGEA